MSDAWTKQTSTSWVVGVAGLVGSVGATFLWQQWTLSCSAPLVSGNFCCACGQVQGEFTSVPFNSPSAACHCPDCAQFVDWCASAAKPGQAIDMKCNHGASEMIQLYKNQFRWTAGASLVRRATLRKNAPLLRLYTECCHTPLALTSSQSPYFPLLILYRNLLHVKGGATGDKNGDGFAPTQYRLFTKYVPPASRTWNESSSDGNPPTVTSEALSGCFLRRVLGRVLYGMCFHCYEPSPLDDLAQDHATVIVNP